MTRKTDRGDKDTRRMVVCNGSASIRLNSDQLYVVRVGELTYKVAL